MRLSPKLAAFAFAAAAALPAVAQDVVLKVHHFWPPGAMPPSTILTPWCDKIAKDSGNRMKCQIYPAMQLGGSVPQNLVRPGEGRRGGRRLDAWPGYSAGTRSRCWKCSSCRFMSSSAEATSQAVWDYVQPSTDAEEFPGIKCTRSHVTCTAAAYIQHESRGQVVVIGRLARACGVRAPTRRTNKDAGGARRRRRSACRLPASSPEALSKGVIDGYPAAVGSDAGASRSHELARSIESETRSAAVRALYTAVFILAMNQAKYDSLPADLKKVIDANSGAALSRQMGVQWDASAPPARKLAVERGNTFYVIPASELETWQKATASLADDWVKDVSAKGNDGAALLKSARDLIAKYEKK